MAQQKPSIGRIVHYVLSYADADAINRRRADTSAHLVEHRERADGSQVHVGNSVSAGEAYPAMVVRDWGDAVNLQVVLDGNDIYWATSVLPGETEDEQRTWHWPERV